MYHPWVDLRITEGIFKHYHHFNIIRWFWSWSIISSMISNHDHYSVNDKSSRAEVRQCMNASLPHDRSSLDICMANSFKYSTFDFLVVFNINHYQVEIAVINWFKSCYLMKLNTSSIGAIRNWYGPMNITGSRSFWMISKTYQPRW